jgi:hypothetical protein
MTDGSDQMAYIQVQEEAARDRLEIKRALGRLKTLSFLSYGSLPVAALAAGVAASTAPITFPVVAGVAAAAVGLGEFLARRERRELTDRLNKLKNQRVLDATEVANISSTANTFTIAGSST